MVKSCNNIWGQCTYRMISSSPMQCLYDGYCDHQLPIDSRIQPLLCNYIPGTDSSQQIRCLCGGSVCTDGKTCSICGKPKY
jgi:hypothetical protein